MSHRMTAQEFNEHSILQRIKNNLSEVNGQMQALEMKQCALRRDAELIDPYFFDRNSQGEVDLGKPIGGRIFRQKQQHDNPIIPQVSDLMEQFFRAEIANDEYDPYTLGDVRKSFLQMSDECLVTVNLQVMCP